MNSRLSVLCILLVATLGCTKIGIDELKLTLGHKDVVKEDLSNFKLLGGMDIGTAGAAGISAFEPKQNAYLLLITVQTKKLMCFTLAILQFPC